MLKQYNHWRQLRRLNEDPVQKILCSKFDGLISRRNDSSGIYVYGSVGSGKTMMMDCFCEALASDKKQTVRRVHFNEFMLDFHKKMHKNNVHEAVQKLCEPHSILCLDEFQLMDVADVVFLDQIFRKLFQNGVMLVATSNRHPDDLYKNGINREAVFQPFCNLLKDKLELFSMSREIDYRKIKTRQASKIMFDSTDTQVKARMDSLFNKLAGVKMKQVEIRVSAGRILKVDHCYDGVARASFEQLCVDPVGASDFIALASQCHTLFLDQVPFLHPHMHNEARRFVVLIDILYDRKCTLIMAGDAPISNMFSSFIQGSKNAQIQIKVVDKGGSSGRSTTMLSDQVEWSATGRIGVSLAELSAVEDVAFAFDRAQSRLIEMQSVDYLKSQKEQ